VNHPRHARNDRGVVAIELVLVMPFIIALLACSISLAGLFQTKSRVVGAARDYARALALKPGASVAPGDPNSADGITVALASSSAMCPALTDPVYQSATPPQVIAVASKTYVVKVAFVGSWTKVVTEEAKMPCG
jgi:Flp pilus assembly protein TadG